MIDQDWTAKLQGMTDVELERLNVELGNERNEARAKQVLIQGEFDRRETERRHSAIVSALSPDERRALLERLQTIEAPTVASPGGVKQPG